MFCQVQDGAVVEDGGVSVYRGLSTSEFVTLIGHLDQALKSSQSPDSFKEDQMHAIHLLCQGLGLVTSEVLTSPSAPFTARLQNLLNEVLIKAHRSTLQTYFGHVKDMVKVRTCEMLGLRRIGFAGLFPTLTHPSHPFTHPPRAAFRTWSSTRPLPTRCTWPNWKGTSRA